MCADTFVTSGIRNDDDKRATNFFKLQVGERSFIPSGFVSISDI